MTLGPVPGEKAVSAVGQNDLVNATVAELSERFGQPLYLQATKPVIVRSVPEEGYEYRGRLGNSEQDLIICRYEKSEDGSVAWRDASPIKKNEFCRTYRPADGTFLNQLDLTDGVLAYLKTEPTIVFKIPEVENTVAIRTAECSREILKPGDYLALDTQGRPYKFNYHQNTSGSDPAYKLSNPSLNTTCPVQLGENLSEWECRMKQFIEAEAQIVTFRGAGSVNGIHPDDEVEGVSRVLDMLASLDSSRPIVLMYDGDTDTRDNPDIGSIFGKISDRLKCAENVFFVAVQQTSWSDGRVIESSNGTIYETYIFDDKVKGSHAALTQSSLLVSYNKYQQIFVGPVGIIGLEQLNNLARTAKTCGRRVPVSVLTGRVDPNGDNRIRQKMENQTDSSVLERLQAQLEQRSNSPLGLLSSPESLQDENIVGSLILEFSAIETP